MRAYLSAYFRSLRPPRTSDTTGLLPSLAAITEQTFANIPTLLAFAAMNQLLDLFNRSVVLI